MSGTSGVNIEFTGQRVTDSGRYDTTLEKSEVTGETTAIDMHIQISGNMVDDGEPKFTITKISINGQDINPKSITINADGEVSLVK